MTFRQQSRDDRRDERGRSRPTGPRRAPAGGAARHPRRTRRGGARRPVPPPDRRALVSSWPDRSHTGTPPTSAKGSARCNPCFSTSDVRVPAPRESRVRTTRARFDTARSRRSLERHARHTDRRGERRQLAPRRPGRCRRRSAAPTRATPPRARHRGRSAIARARRPGARLGVGSARFRSRPQKLQRLCCGGGSRIARAGGESGSPAPRSAREGRVARIADRRVGPSRCQRSQRSGDRDASGSRPVAR